jgi:hypothetical protein
MDKFGPIKSVIISGNLNKKLFYKLCPNNEFSDGYWNISINTVAYSCRIANFNVLCELTCNLVRGQKYNDSFQVESYDHPLAIFLLETTKTTIHFGIYEHSFLM